jgi:anti-anti-sigma regulatory factor
MEVHPALGSAVVAGELDRRHRELFLDGLGLLVATTHDVWRLDLADVVLCDGAGLRGLVEGHALARRHGRRLAVVRCSACVHRDLAGAGLAPLLCDQGCAVLPVTAATTAR